jgi:hypothetical protein
MENVSKEIVNTSEVRAGAFLNFILLGTSIYLSVTGNSILLSVLLFYIVLGFARAGWSKPMISNTYIIKKLKRFFGEGISESSLPVRFSSKIGFSLTLVALVLNIINSYAIIFIMLCFIASALNAFTGFCIACKLYPRYNLIKHHLSIFKRDETTV